MNLINKQTCSLMLAAAALLVPASSMAHPGNLDINGGHYMGPSYHCHLSGCEMPDTFSRLGNSSRLGDNRSREKFFNRDDWDYEVDGDGDCQSTRQEMLVLTSRAEVKFTNPRNCIVRTGEWLDEYTGEVYTVATQMDLDHVIPLMYAHTHGGDRWMPQKKLQFANDPMNLMLVGKREIRRKRDNGPRRYLPREEFQCEYAYLWQTIADKYNLRLDRRDENEIEDILEACPAPESPLGNGQ